MAATRLEYITERRDKLVAEQKAIEKANWLLSAPTPQDVPTQLENLAAGEPDELYSYFLSKTASILRALPE